MDTGGLIGRFSTWILICEAPQPRVEVLHDVFRSQDMSSKPTPRPTSSRHRAPVAASPASEAKDTDSRPQVLPKKKAAIRPVVWQEGASLVNQAVDALRRVVLAASGEGVFLGSEEQLIAALGVSRPTFRQAAKLLRHENLLTIKRGMGGGFFTQSPSGEAVSRMAAIYLNAQGTSLRQLNDVVAPLQAEAARLLARNPDQTLRAGLVEFLAQHSDDGPPKSEKDMIRRMLAFEQLLGELAGNPAIALVMKMMRDLVRDERHSYFTVTPERIMAYVQFQRRLAQAIQEGDAEMATLICERHGAEVGSWLPDQPVALSS